MAGRTPESRRSSYSNTLELIRRNIRMRHIMTPDAEVYKTVGSKPASDVFKVMKKRNYDMVPITDAKSNVIGYLLKDDLKGRSLKGKKVLDFRQRLEMSNVVSSNTPVLRHLRIWDERSSYLVK